MRTTIRIILAFFIFGISWYVFSIGTGKLVYLRFLIVPVMLIGPAMLIGPLLATWLSSPFAASLYPGRKVPRGSPVYSTVDSLRMRGMYKDALLALEDILIKFPADLESMYRSLEIITYDMKNPSLAKACLDKFLASLKNPDHKRQLRYFFERL